MVAALVIRHNNDNGNYRVVSCQKPFRIDIADTFAKKTEGKVMTKEVALKALRSIERESKFKNFITHPAVIITTGVIALTAGIVLGVLSNGVAAIAALIAMKVLGAVLGGVGGIVMVQGFKAMCNGSWGDMCQAYKNQAIEARRYIDDIKARMVNNGGFAIEIAR
jgi:hypothetical protein